MKRLALLLVFVPVHADAVEGVTVFSGPDVLILQTVENDFPRYDVEELCRTAMPGTTPSVVAARTVCKLRQGRLAALTSQDWNQIPPPARIDCAKRAEGANGSRYYVLFSCVRAKSFRLQRQDTIARLADRIARQTGKVPVDPQAVGSIK